MLTTPRPPPAEPTPALSPLAARIRAATSAPVPLFAGTWLHFANELLTQCWAQRPNTSGTMKKSSQTCIAASCHHDAGVKRDHAARSGTQRFALELRQIGPPGQQVADGARGARHRRHVDRLRAARAGQERPRAQRPEELRD